MKLSAPYIATDTQAHICTCTYSFLHVLETAFLNCRISRFGEDPRLISRYLFGFRNDIGCLYYTYMQEMAAQDLKAVLTDILCLSPGTWQRLHSDTCQRPRLRECSLPAAAQVRIFLLKHSFPSWVRSRSSIRIDVCVPCAVDLACLLFARSRPG